MKLRWIKKETEKGKYILQILDHNEWVGVPCVEEQETETKQEALTPPRSFRDDLAQSIAEKELSLIPEIRLSTKHHLGVYESIADLVIEKVIDEVIKEAEKFNNDKSCGNDYKK